MLDLTPLERSGFVRTYGQPVVGWDGYDEGDEPPASEFRQGVCADHVRAALELPGTRGVVGTLCNYVVDEAAGGLAYPVTCAELVEVWTEDGPTDGRCGALATDREFLACEGHAAERASWAALSEAERAHWEREHDHMNP
jgi:hypothetical protein